MYKQLRENEEESSKEGTKTADPKIDEASTVVEQNHIGSSTKDVPKTQPNNAKNDGPQHEFLDPNGPPGTVASPKMSGWTRLANRMAQMSAGVDGPNKRELVPADGSTGQPVAGAISMDNSSQQNPRMKFRTIAKGLSLMSRVRVADAALTREQHAFFSKYGISTSDGILPGEEELDNARRGGHLFDWHGISKLEFFRHKFVVDSGKDYYYRWLGIVTLAYCYNLLFIVYRTVFIDSDSVSPLCLVIFLGLDVLFDIVYLLDSFVRVRTGYLDQGLLVRDVHKIHRRFRKNKMHLFWLDLASCLPIDYLFQFVFWTTNPWPRLNRLLRIDRPLYFQNATEMRMSKPNIFRVFCVFLYISILIHWNACFYFFVSYMIGIGSDGWVYGKANIQSLPPGVEDTLGRRYLYSFYWSTLMLTTIGEVPWPVKSIEFAIVCMDLLFGVLIFATIVGNVGSMITNAGAARSNFQSSIDDVKSFLKLRSVGRKLVHRISRWFDYLWQNKQTIGQDQEVLKLLPNKLQAEIAMHVHFETLRKVRLFQDCEAGLLGELVLKLELQVFSPMDYVCRKGDVGKEMYIVKKGRLQVVSDDGTRVLHTLQEGAVFGELSLLNIPGSKQGNRRSASIRSVGYTDLFMLRKADLWAALAEYPDAKKLLVQKGREMLRKDGMLDETVPEEIKSEGQQFEQVRQHIDALQERLARLTAEYVSAEARLQARAEALEKELAQYEK